MASKLDGILETVLTPGSGLDGLVERLAGADDEEVDYQLEAQLEALTDALAGNPVTLAAALKKRGKSLKDLGGALCKVWLEGDVPRCGAELKVRAAEALGAWSIAVEESRADILKRLKSKRFEHRMWAARAVRASGWDDAEDVLAPLAEDPYEDDNGYFLVREAAGFTD
jgi:hypothetical protein